MIKHQDHDHFTEFIWGLQFPSDRVFGRHSWQHGGKQVGMAEAVAETLHLEPLAGENTLTGNDMGFLKLQSPPPVTSLLQQGHTS